MGEKLKIAIVGLGLIGTSAGLALRRYQDRVTVTGHDRDSSVAGMARKLGAVDRTEWNLISAVAGADRILLALPLAEMRETLQAIAADLKPGCLVVDTADVKGPVLAWARELLPDTVSFVGGHPIVIPEKSGQEGARADLFERKLFCLVADVAAQPGAVRLAADLVEALGGKPFFMDATEHDGLAAAVEHLPRLMAAVLTTLAGQSSGWSDMRKVAGGQFYTSTAMTADSGQVVAAGLLANREHLLYWLDAFVAEMTEWRRRLEAGDQQRLAEDLEQSLFTGRQWLADYTEGSWEREAPVMELPTARGMLRDMFGFGRGRKPAERDKSR